MVQSPRLRNTPGGAKCFGGEGGSGKGGRSLTTVGVCVQQQDRAAGGRVLVPAGLTRTRLPLVSRRAAPRPPAARAGGGRDSRRAVAQLVAHVVRDHGAAGSNPACSTRLDSSAGRAAARRAARPRFDSWSRHAAPVAQPDRVPGYEPGGWGFDSLQARDRCPLAQWGERASDIREVAGSSPAGRTCGRLGRSFVSYGLRTPCFGVPVRVQAGACTHARTVHFRERRWTMNEPVIFGTHEDKTLAQLRDVASRAERVALMADGHLGYIMPIGGVA